MLNYYSSLSKTLGLHDSPCIPNRRPEKENGMGQQDVAILEAIKAINFWPSEIGRLQKVKMLTGYRETIVSIGSLYWINKNILLYCGERELN
jgi:hypothetical protein